MTCRGVRGATTANSNTREDILGTTRQLLALMIRQNKINPVDVASVTFSTTFDLDAEFPALAARQLGWFEVPMLCTHEMDVPNSLRRCVRIMINWNTDTPQHEIVHVYIKDAMALRPDISKLPPVDWDDLETWIEDHLADVDKGQSGK
jgi:chorismate mutase